MSRGCVERVGTLGSRGTSGQHQGTGKTTDLRCVRVVSGCVKRCERMFERLSEKVFVNA